jgi:hypothetical protein
MPTAADGYGLTPPEERAHEVLVAHQRRDVGSCGCGWGVDTGRLGRSHAGHVLDEMAAADLLIVERPQGLIDLRSYR